MSNGYTSLAICILLVAVIGSALSSSNEEANRTAAEPPRTASPVADSSGGDTVAASEAEAQDVRSFAHRAVAITFEQQP